MEYLIAFAITVVIVFGISKIVFPKKKSDNSLTGKMDKVGKVAEYFTAFAIFIVANVALNVLLPISVGVYAEKTGEAIAISFLFFPITYSALKNQLKLDFSNVQMFVCFLIGVFAITVIDLFFKSTGDVEMIVTTLLVPLMVFGIIIQQFDVRKKAKSARGTVD
jgi:hypothetical protein